MAVFAAQGDPRRSMPLLWRAPDSSAGHPGPKPALNVDVIVDAAIAVADAEGMAGLSMRAVGERLGCTAMALYTYVADKSALVDLMYDRAHAELATDYRGPWRAAVTAWAEDLWAFYLRHPWVLTVSQARPVLGPHEFDVLEALLRALRGTGLSGREVRSVVGTLSHFVRGAAQMSAESRQAAAATGLSDDDWWYARSPLLSEVAPDFAERYPEICWLEAERAGEPVNETVPYMENEARETFEVGLSILLDGVSARM
ncbi:TetR/AcrR family transcriptional regulator [Actinokineospora iranica]|uniref:Regulatory protein, tetR family n=1 Tax=Actinokineospora iranica TaxID=1271860 RepID=A0A1G6JD91_9PSEU|nr:TetR/AcrR family transcriptional regulator [Actinokineospora iranica]SDC16774.1 regulatory protein, tetR family [Actinokineospora iranica]